MKNYLIQGNITPGFIAEQIARHSSKTDIGAHAIFLGQVRKDEVNNKRVTAIEYSTYPELTNKVIDELREKMFSNYQLRCLHVYHSIGKVSVGENSLFVFISSSHRGDSLKALPELVDEIKRKVPMWKKEIFEDDSYRWIE